MYNLLYNEVRVIIIEIFSEYIIYFILSNILGF